MWDMVTPLEVGGKHVGNVFIGQFFYEDETPDVELFREQARKFGFDETEYLAALDRVPRFSREKANAGMQFYAKLTKMISSLSFSSIKLSRILNERIQLEEQLRQSQKMEAIGLLAGGVAHDFNNILSVIMGYCSIFGMNPDLDPKLKKATVEIMSAAERAAQLTKGLLAFSRKQVLSVKNENLNDIIHHVEKFVSRIIGEDILFKSVYNERELPVCVDASQIEQVLINLATNARDAMPTGGNLTVETSLQEVTDSFKHTHGYAQLGQYACIYVSDTGCGMNEEVRSKIFEPFFTTKEVGKGTGLGMAIVYGIIKQHNGFITVYSEAGTGTTFKIYLPIAHSRQIDSEEENMQTGPEGGTETILLVEDDIGVREFTFTILSEFGYDVIQAIDGFDAIDKFRVHQNRIKLVLMDMIMPKMNGREAYDEISKISTGVKILFTSGYTADFIQNRGVSEEGIELIMKPVQPLDLLRKIREILDR
jgi:polar amino acid transport system substrate-binding protein